MVNQKEDKSEKVIMESIVEKKRWKEEKLKIKRI